MPALIRDELWVFKQHSNQTFNPTQVGRFKYLYSQRAIAHVGSVDIQRGELDIFGKYERVS